MKKQFIQAVMNCFQIIKNCKNKYTKTTYHSRILFKENEFFVSKKTILFQNFFSSFAEGKISGAGWQLLGPEWGELIHFIVA